MGKRMESLNADLIDFIKRQPFFTVGTARSNGRVNISPKGMDTFRVIDGHTVVWLNLTGSGNETAAHLLENNRMTILFSAFEGKPLILRLYGNAVVYHENDEEYKEHIDFFPPMLGARQIVHMTIDLVQTSCGFGVPLMDYKSDRQILSKWAADKGIDKIKEYQQLKNKISLDGFETGI